MNRYDIEILSRHSNLTTEETDLILRNQVYSNIRSWKYFLNMLFIVLGVGFTLAGIIFFFAYNWDDLHKFAKMGLVEGLIITTTATALLARINVNVKNILLTASSVLVGVLMAVFGQIYQTGANAYDFFLGWIMFITLWVVVLGYPPLWLIYLILANTTIILYADQVAHYWSQELLFCILFLLNALITVTIHLVRAYRNDVKIPHWFLSTTALAAATFATLGLIIGIFNEMKTETLLLLLFTTLAYAAGIAYSIKNKRLFYLSVIPFSITIVISSAILKAFENDASVQLFICLFIIGSVTLMIHNLIVLQKKWHNG